MSKLSLALLLAMATFAGSAQAGLIQVKSVTITNAVNDFLQVSEFQAYETGTGNNVALLSTGASATTTTGQWDGNSGPGKAIDGQYSDLSFPNMFHNSEYTYGNGNLTITFAGVKELDSINIYGRSDCCSFRDKYNLSFFDVDGKLLYTAMNVDASSDTHMASVQLPNTDVPEPGSLALLGLGLMGLAGGRLRQRSR